MHWLRSSKHRFASFLTSTKHATWHAFEQIKFEERFKTSLSFRKTQSRHFKFEKKRERSKNESFEKFFESFIETSCSKRLRMLKKRENLLNEQRIASRFLNLLRRFFVVQTTLWFSSKKQEFNVWSIFFSLRSLQSISMTLRNQHIRRASIFSRSSRTRSVKRSLKSSRALSRKKTKFSIES